MKDLYKNENYCVATIAIIKYFSECDGDISIDEDDMLNATVEYISENVALSEESQRKIDIILSKKGFTFDQMKLFLNRIKYEELLTLTALVDEVINCSEGITLAEAKAKSNFDYYVKKRQLYSWKYNK